MASKTLKDGRIESRVANYAGFFEKDYSKDSKVQQENRLENYADVINGYYDGATELYEYGWAQSFHFSRFYKGEGFHQSLARHEHYLAAQMKLKPGMKVLDVGCGIGGPAREIARFSNAHITGIFSVLKPGGVFGVYEWVMTDAYDASNADHRRIAHGIEIGDGIPEMRTRADSRKALLSVGFQIEHDEDLAERPDPVPWYYPLEGDLRKAQTIGDYGTVFRTTKFGMWTTSTMVWVLETFGLVPKGTWSVGETLKISASALVEGGQKKLFTPMLLYVCRKPATG
ncbi:Delta(24)-sterol C-methyltransferase [Tulasnella sp. JGI-2019a]|nr:Delta(24)-sterol C-methyltransferase [Tulasnella sp. JGI-2019a]